MFLRINLLNILLDCDGVRMTCHVSQVVQLGIRGQRLLLHPETLPCHVPRGNNVDVFSHCVLFILLLRGPCGGGGWYLLVFLLSEYLV